MKNEKKEAECTQEFLRQLEEKRKKLEFLPSVSFGLATFSGENIVDVKDRADRNMYQYKKMYKNRISAE